MLLHLLLPELYVTQSAVVSGAGFKAVQRIIEHAIEAVTLKNTHSVQGVQEHKWEQADRLLGEGASRMSKRNE